MCFLKKENNMKYLVAMMIAAFGFSSAFTAEVKKDEKKPVEKK